LIYEYLNILFNFDKIRKNNDIKNKQLLNDEMTEKINSIESEIKTYEKMIKEKENDIEKLNKQLKDATEKNKKDVIIKLYCF